MSQLSLFAQARETVVVDDARGRIVYTPDFVPAEVIQDRFERLAQLQNLVSLELNQATVGQRLEVLSEGPSRKDLAVTTARSRTGKVVHVDGVHPAGSFLDVDVIAAAPHHLLGSLR